MPKEPFTPHDDKTLTALADELRRLGGMLDDLAADFRKRKISKSLLLDNQKKIDAGILAVEKLCLEAQYKMGLADVEKRAAKHPKAK